MRKVVMTFGAFDSLHMGHLYYLRSAKKRGRLIVAIARDKTSWKPSIGFRLPENERKKLVESLGIADKVILGSTKNAFEKIMKIKPAIIVVTPYHGINAKILERDLRHKGLKTKVVMLPRYNPRIYDKQFSTEYLRKHMLGLTPAREWF